MSGRNTDVPSMAAAALPVPVAVAEYEQCPATDVLHRVGDKWTVLLVVLLGKRPYRFNELQRAIDGISQRMLTRTLRTLEQDGIVRRTVFPTVPPSVEYSVTELGRSLLVPLSAVADWAVEHHAEIVAARQSARTGIPPGRSAPPTRTSTSSPGPLQAGTRIQPRKT